MEKLGKHYIALVLDVAKWKPPKFGCLGFDASIHGIETKCDPSAVYLHSAIKVGGRVCLEGDACLADDVDPGRSAKDRHILELASPIMIGRFDSFELKFSKGVGLFLHMHARFDDKPPADGELEAQGFIHDYTCEAGYWKD
jgi:hypothetical protein